MGFSPIPAVAVAAASRNTSIDNKQFLLNQLIWIGISLGISIAISIILPFPSLSEHPTNITTSDGLLYCFCLLA